MIIEMKAKVTLTLEDLQQAVTNYINDNGLEIGDKAVSFIDFPEELVVEVEGCDAAKADAKPEAKAKPKSRAKPQTVAPAVMPTPVATAEQPAEDPVQAAMEQAEAERVAEAERERIKAEEFDRKQAEEKARVAEVLAQGEAILAKPKETNNPFAKLNQPTEADKVEEPVEEEAEPLAGQDILDNPQAAAPKPHVNPFLSNQPKPQASTTSSAVPAPGPHSRASSIFA